MNSAPVLLFDLDGTLVDSLEDLRISSNLLLRELGYPPMETAVLRPCIGKGVHYLIRCMVGRAEQLERARHRTKKGEEGWREHTTRNDALRGKDDAGLRDAAGESLDLEMTVGRYRAIYAEHAMDTTVPYPGVPEILNELHGVPKAVISNKPAAASRAILEALDLARHFACIAGGDSFAEMKPSPLPLLRVLARLNAQPDQGWMIGDSVYDIEAGKRAGTQTIAVTYGFQSPEMLKALEPDYTVSAFAEIPGILARSAGR